MHASPLTRRSFGQDAPEPTLCESGGRVRATPWSKHRTRLAFLRAQVAERSLRLKHADEIRNQIIINEEKTKRERQKFLEDGNKLRAKREQESKHLEDIKQKKLEELRSAGVHQKYWAELEAKRFH